MSLRATGQVTVRSDSPVAPSYTAYVMATGEPTPVPVPVTETDVTLSAASYAVVLVRVWGTGAPLTGPVTDSVTTVGEPNRLYSSICFTERVEVIRVASWPVTGPATLVRHGCPANARFPPQKGSVVFAAAVKKAVWVVPASDRSIPASRTGSPGRGRHRQRWT